MKRSFLLLMAVLVFLACKDDKEETPVGNNPAPVDTAYKATITFPSEDGLEITADLYHQNNTYPVMVLCHQANWSRGEYQETAVKFNAMGYNCLAIDQRSGSGVNGVTNETAARALSQNLPNQFLDAEQDIVAAVNYAANKYGRKVILIGSSYSAGLVLKVAKEQANVEMVLSFSPGEYYANFSLADAIDGLNKPAFLTSSKSEASQVLPLFSKVGAAKKEHFIPNGDGEHGSRALWEVMPDHKEYWQAVTAFLQ